MRQILTSAFVVRATSSSYAVRSGRTVPSSSVIVWSFSSRRRLASSCRRVIFRATTRETNSHLGLHRSRIYLLIRPPIDRKIRRASLQPLAKQPHLLLQIHILPIESCILVLRTPDLSTQLSELTRGNKAHLGLLVLLCDLGYSSLSSSEEFRITHPANRYELKKTAIN